MSIVFSPLVILICGCTCVLCEPDLCLELLPATIIGDLFDRIHTNGSQYDYKMTRNMKR